MSGRSAAGRLLIPAAAVVLVPACLGLLPTADWGAVAAKLAALPWGGPLWWLLRTALVLTGNIF